MGHRTEARPPCRRARWPSASTSRSTIRPSWPSTCGHSPTDPEWANTRVVGTPKALEQLKQQSGGDIAVLGSSALTVSLLEEGLLDELRIMVHPVVIGRGRSVFGTATARIDLELVKSRVFESGNVLHHYAPVR